MNLKKIIAIGAIAASTLIAVAPSSAAVVDFGQFSSIGNTRNFRWIGNGSNATFYTTSTASATSAGVTRVSFSYTQDALAPFAQNLFADLLINGTVTNTNATINGMDIVQSNITGTFSLILANLPGNTITVGNNPTFGAGTNLISGDFSNVTLSGRRNLTLLGGTGSGTNFTSGVLSFDQGSSFEVLLGISSITPGVNATNAANAVTGAPNKALRSFRGRIGATFSSDPAAITPSVPEPASWMLMIAGFGMVGVSARRRSRQSSVVA